MENNVIIRGLSSWSWICKKKTIITFTVLRSPPICNYTTTSEIQEHISHLWWFMHVLLTIIIPVNSPNKHSLLINIIIDTMKWGLRAGEWQDLDSQWGSYQIIMRFVSRFSSKLLLTQKLHSFNDGGPGGRRVHVDLLQPNLQHLHKASCWHFSVMTARVPLGISKWTSNQLPSVCHLVVEGTHQIF